MRNSWGGLVESRLPSSTRPGLVRQASGVMVEVGTGDGVSVAGRVGEIIGGGEVGVGVGWLKGAQAYSPARNMRSDAINFIRRIASLIA